MNNYQSSVFTVETQIKVHLLFTKIHSKRKAASGIINNLKWQQPGCRITACAKCCRVSDHMYTNKKQEPNIKAPSVLTCKYCLGLFKLYLSAYIVLKLFY